MELFQILILLGVGVVAGLSMSIVGQTGQGIIVPIIFLFTGDILLAIAISLLNDLIGALTVSGNYIKNKNYIFRKNIFLFLGVAISISVLGVYILMVTNISNTFGWLVPIITIIIGLGIAMRGFPTSESLKKMVHSFKKKLNKSKKAEDESEKLEEEMDELLVSGDEIKPLMDPTSKSFYSLILIFGAFVGLLCGIFGISGGANVVFVLVLLFGYPIKKGVGTAILLSLFLIVFTFTSFQLLAFSIKGQFYFNLEMTLYLGISTFITGLIASVYVQKISPKLMGQFVGVMMIAVSTVTLIIVMFSP